VTDKLIKGIDIAESTYMYCEWMLYLEERVCGADIRRRVAETRWWHLQYWYFVY